MMSRRTKKDYEAVFVELSQHLGSDIKLEDCIIDFEAATWTSLCAVFPGVSIHGCLFHLVQAIYGKVGELGLVKEYKENEEIRKFIRKLFALPFLPPRDMRFGLTILMESEEANMTDVKILDILHHVEKQWFRNSVWKPQDLCGLHPVKILIWVLMQNVAADIKSILSF